jgi:tetratricopeptide (TPR) repeat protein
MMTPPAPPLFLDVPTLLERSQPRPQPRVWTYVMGIMLLLLLLSAWAGSQSTAVSGGIELVTSLAMFGLIGGATLLSVAMVRKQRHEQHNLQSIDELIQLRRWDQAAVSLQSQLAAPARSVQGWGQSLVYLATVLARYHRYEDAIAVHEHILNLLPVDPMTAYGVRLGRAMAMLHEDHLFDADRAIAELRRGSGAGESGALALLEIYRDVKTGHPREAIEMFEQKLDVMRSQLGQRVGDAYGLIARAYDLIDDQDAAKRAYERATRLIPESELSRRYSEFAALAGKYQPARMPAEAA